MWLRGPTAHGRAQGRCQEKLGPRRSATVAARGRVDDADGHGGDDDGDFMPDHNDEYCQNLPDSTAEDAPDSERVGARVSERRPQSFFPRILLVYEVLRLVQCFRPNKTPILRIAVSPRGPIAPKGATTVGCGIHKRCRLCTPSAQQELTCVPALYYFALVPVHTIVLFVVV